MTDREKEKVIKGLEAIVNDDWMWKNAGYCAGICKDALALLKAQEPIAPVTSEVQYGDHLRHCPSCGKALPNIGEYGKSNYCYKCGQAVKWK